VVHELDRAHQHLVAEALERVDEPLAQPRRQTARVHEDVLQHLLRLAGAEEDLDREPPYRVVTTGHGNEHRSVTACGCAAAYLRR
jgi:hypothetical protein